MSLTFLRTWNQRTWLIASLIAVWAVVTVGLAGYFIWHIRPTDPAAVTAQAKQKLSRHINFAGVEPTIATVTDAKTLKAAATFYQRAENGDLLVVWEEKALLYRPDSDRIVDFGIVLKAPTGATPTAGPTAPTPTSQKAKILILNGSAKRAAAAELKKQLETNPALMSQIDSITVGDAKHKNYDHSVISDISHAPALISLLTDLTKTQNAQLEAWPATETSPESYDISIIIGSQN